MYNCRLLQSLILEPQSSEVMHKALEAIPMQLLQQLSSDINTEVHVYTPWGNTEVCALWGNAEVCALWGNYCISYL